MEPLIGFLERHGRGQAIRAYQTVCQELDEDGVAMEAQVARKKPLHHRFAALAIQGYLLRQYAHFALQLNSGSWPGSASSGHGASC